MSPKVLQSPEDYPTIEENISIKNQNQSKQLARISSDTGVKIRRYLNLILAITYLFTKPLIEIE